MELNCLGCSCISKQVSSELQKLHRYLGFNDKDEDGVIEKKSFKGTLWRDEGYKEEGDIDGDGKIIEIEAKYYLQSLKSIEPKIKEEFALTNAENYTLFAIYYKYKRPGVPLPTERQLGCPENFRALAQEAITMINNGQFKEAAELGLKTEDPYCASAFVAEIAKKTVSLGLFQETLDLIEAAYAVNDDEELYHAPKPSYIITSLIEIAELMTKTPGFTRKHLEIVLNQALEKARLLDSEEGTVFSRAFETITIAKTMRRLGFDTTKIKKILDEAAREVLKIRKKNRRFSILRDLVVQYLAIGKQKKAVRIASKAGAKLKINCQEGNALLTISYGYDSGLREPFKTPFRIELKDSYSISLDAQTCIPTHPD